MEIVFRGIEFSVPTPSTSSPTLSFVFALNGAHMRKIFHSGESRSNSIAKFKTNGVLSVTFRG